MYKEGLVSTLNFMNYFCHEYWVTFVAKWHPRQDSNLYASNYGTMHCLEGKSATGA